MVQNPHQDNTLVFLVLKDEVVYEKVISDNKKAAKFINIVNARERNYNEMSNDFTLCKNCKDIFKTNFSQFMNEIRINKLKDKIEITNIEKLEKALF